MTGASSFTYYLSTAGGCPFSVVQFDTALLLGTLYCSQRNELLVIPSLVITLTICSHLWHSRCGELDHAVVHPLENMSHHTAWQERAPFDDLTSLTPHEFFGVLV